MRNIWTIFACFIFFISWSALSADSHCKLHEQTIFSCSLGKKMVSVCGSEAISPTVGYVQYRFGIKGQAELLFPHATDSADRSTIRSKTLMFSGGGGAYLRFINGDYNYIVYTAVGKGWGTKEGVVVKKDNQQISHLKCLDIPDSKLGDDFFTSAGLMADQDQFVLP